MRLASIEDSSSISDLYIQSRFDWLNFIPPIAHSVEKTHEWLRNRIKNGEEFWVTEDDRGLTGFLLLEPGWIDQLYVRKDCIRQGLGLSFVEKAKSRFPAGLQLWTFQTNMPARKFYESQSFVIAELTSGEHNEERTPDVRYIWNPEI